GSGTPVPPSVSVPDFLRGFRSKERTMRFLFQASHAARALRLARHRSGSLRGGRSLLFQGPRGLRAAALWVMLLAALPLGAAFAQDATVAPDLALDCRKAPARVRRVIVQLDATASAQSVPGVLQQIRNCGGQVRGTLPALGDLVVD